MTIQITLESQAVQQALTQLSQRLGNLHEPMSEIGRTLVDNILINLGQGRDYRGHAFDPLSEKYMEAVPRRRGGIPLNDTRMHIYQRITYLASEDSVTVGMNEVGDDPIGFTHQFGLPSRGIPMRPFLPITSDRVDMPDDWEDEVLRIISSYLL